MKKLSTEEFIKRAKETHGDKYDYSITNYINRRTKIKYICPSGHYGEMTWCHFKEGTNCPKCNKIYKGEERIENYLKEKEIEYKTQHIFKDCKNVRPLKFDFYLNNLIY